MRAPVDRREHARVVGPFDGFRIGALETPLRIFDLSRGGCFVNAMHEQKPGIRFLIKIELPYEGPITVTAETLNRRTEDGYAVRFVQMSKDAEDRLERALERLQDKAPYEP